MRVTGGSTETVDVSFSESFPSAPTVVASIMGSVIDGHEGVVISANGRTVEGFSLIVHNATSATYNVSVGWIAIG